MINDFFPIAYDTITYQKKEGIEMRKTNATKNKKGFTLAELLVVVAIIAVLVAIMIPVFSTSVEKANHAANVANIRAAYAEAVTDAMVSEKYSGGKLPIGSDTFKKAKVKGDVKVKFTAGENGKIEIETASKHTNSFEVDADVEFKDGDTEYSELNAKDGNWN